MNDLFENVWGDGFEIAVGHCVDITSQYASYGSAIYHFSTIHQIALFVIGVAGRLCPL